ncbi:MAG: hypothetical protein IKL37_05155 [Alphaproteobacteria bacterium]|nr:hypothetical protein [Alphaproteobacteria bacterium]
MRHNNRATYGILGFTFGMIACIDAQSASVVSRTPRPTSGANAVLAAQSSAATTSAASAPTSTSQPASSAKSPTSGGNIPHSISNKSSYFSSFLGLSSSADATGTSLADKVRAQRELLAAKSATDEIVGKTVTISAGANACDTALRACMMEKCGSDFSKCAGDSDTIWGQKIDSCRRNTTCTGHEYAQIAPEIRADRDFNERISAYTSVIDCGNRYNECIITECGANFGKCLGKTAGDHAISLCDKIARECASADNGLASRVMNVFGTLRGDAERAVQADERRLYELRDTMRGACERLGAMFDERSLDCVFTVNFYAGSDSTLYASKKAYAGASFTCDPNWFGVDVTTFMENAFRLTREQASASAAMLGAGLGVGVGAVTSGAIDRAMTTHAAKKELKDAQQEHEELYGDGTKADQRRKKRCENDNGTWDAATNTCKCQDGYTEKSNGGCKKINTDKKQKSLTGVDKNDGKKSDRDIRRQQEREEEYMKKQQDRIEQLSKRVNKKVSDHLSDEINDNFRAQFGEPLKRDGTIPEIEIREVVEELEEDPEMINNGSNNGNNNSETGSGGSSGKSAPNVTIESTAE